MEFYKDDGTSYETRNDYSYDEANRLTSTVAQTSAGEQTLGWKQAVIREVFTDEGSEG